MADNRVSGTDVQVHRHGAGKARVLVMGAGGSVQAIVELPGDNDLLTDEQDRAAAEIAADQSERAALYLRDRLNKIPPVGA